MSKYFEATGETRATLLAQWDLWEQDRKAALKFSRRMGASRTRFYMNSGSVTGLIFTSEPDPKIWKPLKGTSDGWQPTNRSKASREIDTEMRSFHLGSGLDVAGVLGLTSLKYTSQGFRLPSAGMEVVGKRVILTVHADDVGDLKCTSDLKRISDVQFEKLTGKR